MTTSTRRNLEWVENHEIMARHGDRDALAALRTFAIIASGKARAAARKAVLEIEAEAEPLTFAVDQVDTVVFAV